MAVGPEGLFGFFRSSVGNRCALIKDKRDNCNSSNARVRDGQRLGHNRRVWFWISYEEVEPSETPAQSLPAEPCGEYDGVKKDAGCSIIIKVLLNLHPNIRHQENEELQWNTDHQQRTKPDDVKDQDPY